MAKYLWIIDNGHGEDTPGKRSPVWEDGSQLLEYDFDRDVANEIQIELDKLGIKNTLLVPECNDISLSERVRRANALENDLPEILVSIHGNGSDEYPEANGIETFYYSNNGKQIASIFQKSLIEHTGLRDRGIKTANFYIIKRTSMPAILTENGFFTNEYECKKMMGWEFKNKVVKAHVNAIKKIEDIGYGEVER